LGIGAFTQGGGKLQKKCINQSGLRKKVITIFSILIITLNMLFAGIHFISENAKAETFVLHDAGKLRLEVADTTRIQNIIADIPPDFQPIDDNPQHFLVYHHDGYGVDQVAQLWYDFSITAEDSPISMIQDGTIDESLVTFTQDGGSVSQAPLPVLNDTRIHQRVWTKQGEYWAIVEFTVQNLLLSPLTNVKVGMRHYSEMDAANSLDDRDFWDGADNIYYYNDADLPNRFFGYASANLSNPLNHYYGTDDSLVTISDDVELYAALTGASQTNFPANGAEKVGSVVGWNGFGVPAGSWVKLPYIMAYGDSLASLKDNVSRAQAFWQWISAPKPELLITEIQDSGAAGERIEVYNEGDGRGDMVNYSLSVDGGTTFLIGGSWSSSIINAKGYCYYTTAGNDLGNEGDTITLYNSSSMVEEDEIGYGQEGIAPDPVTDESTARYKFGVLYTDEWVRDGTPTFGSVNDIPGFDISPDLNLNEVLFNPSASEGFIEIYYSGSLNLNLKGMKIVCDAVYVIGEYVVTPNHRYYTLRAQSYPAGFDITANGDNIYLYNSDGTLCDMVGWNTPHLQDFSMRRFPEGSGDNDGHNDSTSLASGWFFDLTPSMFFEFFITEIQDSPAGSEWVEIYNPSDTNSTLDISLWELDIDGSIVTFPMATTIRGGTHFLIGDPVFANITTIIDLNDEGSAITLRDNNGNYIDSADYGQKGSTPDPLTSESTGRAAEYLSGWFLYMNTWAREEMPTPFENNTVGGVNSAPYLVLNEVLFNPQSALGFIELFYNGGNVNYDMNDTISYPFEDATTFGTQITFGDTDDGYAQVTPPFPISFYGSSYATIRVGVNGYLSFVSNPTEYDNQILPQIALPYDNLIAVMWDDLVIGPSPSGIYYNTSGLSPDRIFTITYHQVLHYSGSSYDYTGKHMTFEVNFYESDGRIIFQYENLMPGSINLTNPDDYNENTVGLNLGDGEKFNSYRSILDTDDGLDIEFMPNYELEITNYKIVVDDVYTIGGPGSVSLTPSNCYSTLMEPFYPINFDMDSNADNVYLYDDEGNLLDMVGWNTSHLPDRTVTRVPDGNGFYTGYNDPTSENAGWVFDQMPTLQYKRPIITEIRDGTVEQVEIYNQDVGSINLANGTGWYLTSDSGGPWSLASLGLLGPGAHVNLTLPPGSLNDEAGWIRLFSDQDILWDEVGYGFMGIATDPLTDESTARVWDTSGANYTYNWSRDPTPTFSGGSPQNDVPPHNTTPLVVLNEVMFYPDDPNDAFIEIKYLSDQSIDIGNYFIVCDNIYTIPPSTILTPLDPYYILFRSDAPGFFAQVTPSGDNIYFYNNNGQFIDMVGWSSSHTQNRTVARVPDGYGTYRGFDDTSSVQAGWRFDQFPTIPLVQIGPDSEQYGDLPTNMLMMM
jgi:hypothetical protein